MEENRKERKNVPHSWCKKRSSLPLQWFKLIFGPIKYGGEWLANECLVYVPLWKWNGIIKGEIRRPGSVSPSFSPSRPLPTLPRRLPFSNHHLRWFFTRIFTTSKQLINVIYLWHQTLLSYPSPLHFRDFLWLRNLCGFKSNPSCLTSC